MLAKFCWVVHYALPPTHFTRTKPVWPSRVAASLLIVLLACPFATSASGQTESQHTAVPRTLVRIDQTEQTAALQSLGSDASGFFPSGSQTQQHVPHDALLRFGRAVPLSARYAIWLVDGSRLAAERISWQADWLEILPLWNLKPLRIARTQVQAILLAGPISASQVIALEQRAQEVSGADDFLLLVDGTLIRGTLQWDQTVAATNMRGYWALKTAVGTQQISAQRVRGVVPSPALRSPASTGPNDWSVGLQDGSLLRIRDPLGDGLRLACGIDLTGPAVSQELLRSICMLARCNPGGDLVAAWVPLRYRAVPLLGTEPQLVRWSDGWPVQYFQGYGYPNAIVAAATSRLVYRLDGQQRLRGTVTVQPHADFAGQTTVIPQCQFVVQTSGGGQQTETVWQSPTVSAGQQLSFDVELKDSQLLILGSDSVSAGDLPQAIWLDLVAYPE